MPDQQPMNGARKMGHKDLIEHFGKNPQDLIVLMLWTLRNKLPDMTLEIPMEEVENLQASLQYNEQQANVMVNANDRRVTVFLQDQAGNNIIQSERTEEALLVKERAQAVRAAAAGAEQLIAEHQAMASAGVASDSMTGELYAALRLLATEVRK